MDSKTSGAGNGQLNESWSRFQSHVLAELDKVPGCIDPNDLATFTEILGRICKEQMTTDAANLRACVECDKRCVSCRRTDRKGRYRCDECSATEAAREYKQGFEDGFAAKCESLAAQYQEAGYQAAIQEVRELLGLAAARLTRTVTCDVLRVLAADLANGRLNESCGDAQCVACGEMYMSGEGSPDIAMCPRCWRVPDTKCVTCTRTDRKGHYRCDECEQRLIDDAESDAADEAYQRGLEDAREQAEEATAEAVVETYKQGHVDGFADGQSNGYERGAKEGQDHGYEMGLREAAELLTLAAARMPRTVTCDALRAMAAQLRLDPAGMREQLTDKAALAAQESEVANG